MRPVYLDCNASTPLEPLVLKEIVRSLEEEIGNPGSRTHIYGVSAKRGVESARDSIAKVVASNSDEVFFTSGATESNNLAILGLLEEGRRSKRTHIVSTKIEHKAVLEPLSLLEKHGFEITLVCPTSGGSVEPEEIRAAMRPDTLLVSVMHVNNETGVVQPLEEIAKVLFHHEAFFHVDAAQGFGKQIKPLQNHRIDLISISAHKVYGPKGVGSLIARRRGFKRPPITPLSYGGGQERGLRPGTLPVPLIIGLGKASELALKNSEIRAGRCASFRSRVLKCLSPLGAVLNGDPSKCLPHVLNLSFPGVDSEAAMVALKDVLAISNGSSCTSSSYQPSHVLTAMGLDESRIKSALRISWCHLTADPDWNQVQEKLQQLTKTGVELIAE